ncbi:Uncharacterised protein [Clostridium baratii]|uniref:hypothetical protein n=1 Tax=Clostridium baratii TaxID=1561 RepID=UPI0006BEF767|nr:hypothetical protein [Clostridium baratii]CUO91424.1 Uncharacterised protein [Clostridium baratii]
MENKIVMSESDFIELVLELSENTCADISNYGSCDVDCCNCWARRLKEKIEY